MLLFKKMAVFLLLVQKFSLRSFFKDLSKMVMSKYKEII